MAREKVNHQERISDQLKAKLEPIVEALDNGTADAAEFEMPFSGITCSPYNAETGHIATGCNALIAMINGVQFYSTFQGWEKLGYRVDTKADFYLARPNTFKTEQVNEKTGETEDVYKVGSFRTYAVWSFESVRDNLRTPESDAAWEAKGPRNTVRNKIPAQPWTPPPAPTVDRTVPNARVEALKDALVSDGLTFERTADSRAYYNETADKVHMPNRDLFRATKTSTATECHDSTMLHEFGHATKHKTRLNREDYKVKGKNASYAYEELVAEITAIMLCAQYGVTPSLRMDHLHYIKSWLQALNNDSKFVFSAGAKAQAAVDYMNGLTNESLVAA